MPPTAAAPRSCSRRRFGRLAAGAFLAAAAPTLLAARPAAASRSWCQVDPVLKIDGQVVDIRVASTVAMLDAATGPIAVEVVAPRGTTVELLATDNGFGYGYVVDTATSRRLKATPGSTPVAVAVRCPATSGALPVRVELTPRGPGNVAAGSAEGTANAWVAFVTA